MLLIFEFVDLFQSLWGNTHGVRVHTFGQMIMFCYLDIFHVGYCMQFIH